MYNDTEVKELIIEISGLTLEVNKNSPQSEVFIRIKPDSVRLTVFVNNIHNPINHGFTYFYEGRKRDDKALDSMVSLLKHLASGGLYE